MFKLEEEKYLVDIPNLLSTLLRFLAEFMLAEFRANLHSALYMGTRTRKNVIKSRSPRRKCE